jgi:hypothetical protein
MYYIQKGCNSRNILEYLHRYFLYAYIKILTWTPHIPNIVKAFEILTSHVNLFNEEIGGNLRNLKDSFEKLIVQSILPRSKDKRVISI